MESEAVNLSLGEGLYVILRIGNHQMAIEMHSWEFFPEAGHDRGPKSEIIDEMAESGEQYPSIISMCKESAPQSSTCWQSA